MPVGQKKVTIHHPVSEVDNPSSSGASDVPSSFNAIFGQWQRADDKALEMPGFPKSANS
jgi:hypothetical protein